MFDVLLSEVRRTALRLPEKAAQKVAEMSTIPPAGTSSATSPVAEPDCQQLLGTKSHFNSSRRLTFSDIISANGSTEFSVCFRI